MELQCAHCGGATRVVNTKRKGPRIAYRRHECTKCKERFSTYERLHVPAGVLKKAKEGAGLVKVTMRE